MCTTHCPRQPGLATFLVITLALSALSIAAYELLPNAPVTAAYEDAECQFDGLTCEQGGALIEASQ
jgi:hypothetical protein